MPDAIANLAPPPAPKPAAKASPKGKSLPVKKGFEKELQRAGVQAENPRPCAAEAEPEPAEAQPSEPVKGRKTSQGKPAGVGLELTSIMEAQVQPVADEAVVDAAAEEPSGNPTILPLSFEIEVDEPNEADYSDPDTMTVKESCVDIGAPAAVQLPPAVDMLAVTATLPAGVDELPDTSAPIEATAHLTPTALTERVETGHESVPLTPQSIDEPTPKGVEAVDDPSIQLPAIPARETSAARPTESSGGNPAGPRFVDDNHPRIITALRSDLSRNGGSVTIRLDPPGLGEVQVSVELRDGAMIASIQTSTEDATRLMSHSLGQLKRSLESSGLSVERLQVQQAPRDEQGQRSGDDRPWQEQGDGRSAQQEQQRREIMERVWRRLRGGRDPIDFLI